MILSEKDVDVTTVSFPSIEPVVVLLVAGYGAACTSSVGDGAIWRVDTLSKRR